ncbi:hypothetical protein MARVELLAND_144 [Bacillus phage vB_BspM_MarvelLand]|nr:hypothetical protein MARVELLAND_144 [Bacillus phage vB_BspM_MarvelLand]
MGLIMTPYRDKNNKLIALDDKVVLDGLTFYVEINPFSGVIVVDGDTGQEALRNVHKQVKIIQRGDVNYEDNN